MGQTPAVVGLCSLTILGLALVASSPPSAGKRDFSVSTNPQAIVLTIQIKDMVAPGLEQFEVRGDGLLRRASDRLETSSQRGGQGVLLERTELMTALAQLVEFDVVEADFSQIHREIEPSYGVLPDGRRFHTGASEPGSGCVVTVNFDSIVIGGKRVSPHSITFALEPFASYRSKRPDIRALEGVARFGESLGKWLQRLKVAEGGG